MGNAQDVRTVKRGHIRLLRPPWWDELNDISPCNTTNVSSMNNCETATIASNSKIQLNEVRGILVNQSKGPSESSIIYSNHLISRLDNTIKTIDGRHLYIKYDQPSPLQIHHVLPTLQVI